MEHTCRECMQESLIPLILFETIEASQITIKRPLLFYVTCIRPVAEYACEVFHDSFPKYLSDDLEKLQRRACRIILHGHSYENALNELSLTSLADRSSNIGADRAGFLRVSEGE
jgi:hypothetical protein